MKSILTLSAAALVCVSLLGAQASAQTACKSANKQVTLVSTTVAEKTIVETAVDAGTFKTLVAAVKAADLAEALSGEGPFTVFAPTDEAFAKLPEGTVETLLKPENKDKLISILKFHVVPKKVMAKDVVNLDSAESLQGSDISIKVEDGSVYVAGAKVIKTDIGCSNGVIHVVDTVMMPK